VKFLLPFSLLVSLGGQVAPKRAIPSRAAVDVERIVINIADSISFAQAPRPVAWMPAALAGIWACGFAAIALVRVRAWRRVHAALRASSPLDISAPVAIRSAPGLLEPGVVGLLRPVLLLPDGIADRLTPTQLEAVLAHELCHVRRRDNLSAAVHMVVEAVFWFHPLVWWIGARLVEERERACDEGVLTLGNLPRDYAEAILGVCKLYVESPQVCVSGVTGADLEKRIEAIMNNRIGLGLTWMKKLMLASAGIAALAGPVVIGAVLSVGHAPVLRAQPQVAVPMTPQTAVPIAAPQQVQLQSQRTAPAPASRDHRMLTLLMDFATMTPGLQDRARQAAIEFVQTRLQPDDLMSVMVATNGKLAVVQDFTSDKALLTSAIAGASASVESSVASQLATLEQAAQILGAIPGKKALIYFSSVTFDDREGIQRAIQAAVASNVAFYAIDVGGMAPGSIATFEGTGFPGRHAEIRTYRSNYSTGLLIPLEGLSGPVDIQVVIREVAIAGEGQAVANLRDRVPAVQGLYRAYFRVKPGAYVSTVVVTEQTTGRQLTETIRFEVN
jgi:beta-lactamase regulating signal transducer with metallopeptidase domain